MTTFIDFRYSRALAAALFTGSEKEETEIVFARGRDHFIALDVGDDRTARTVAVLAESDGAVAVSLVFTPDGFLSWCDGHATRVVSTDCPLQSNVVGLCIGPTRWGIRADGTVREACPPASFRDSSKGSSSGLRLECAAGVSVMARGSGRAERWAQLFYQRKNPSGLCVDLTMDWNHLRSGIPLFGTMTAEELVEAGTYRLRFRSYSDDSTDVEVSDFVRLFGSDADPDIAVHLTPALYLRPTPGVPNMAYTVTESQHVHPAVVYRCNTIDRTCVPSTFVRDILRQSGVTGALDVVHHGVDSEYFRPVALKEPLPGGRGFNFLAVGTHVERKNIKHIVRAFLEEFREHEDVALFLLLRPEYLTTQNNIALSFTEWERSWARKSAPILFWTGYVTREHLRDFYANAHAYVMPSNEGFGLTLLEAMACGTPTIALKRGGVLDFVNDGNGILVPTGKSYVASDVDTLPYVGDVFYEPDFRSLRRAMRRLFEDRTLTKRLGDRARLDAEHFSWRSVSQQFVRCIDRTFEESRPESGTGGMAAAARTPPTVTLLTVAFCVLDDVDAMTSLEYLRELTRQDRDLRVLCLFTRYARLADVSRARDFGFAYYRWDGTIENCKGIARSLFRQAWLLQLHPGEQIVGDRAQLAAFLATLPSDVSLVSIPTGTTNEPRVFRLQSQGDAATTVQYSEVGIRVTE